MPGPIEIIAGEPARLAVGTQVRLAPAIDPLIAEGERVMGICNSCRYCEGYCAVFPAMERRLSFAREDLEYLANLCHQCGECYYACQYSPPHEFNINVPQVLGRIRSASYRRYAWPAAFADVFDRHAAFVPLALAFGFSLILFLAISTTGDVLFEARNDADFYAVLPHGTMATLFGVTALFVLWALGAGFARFWRESGESFAALRQPVALASALKDAMTLRYLDGDSSVGCTYPGDQPSQVRRWFHHLTFYGFLLCFASTVVATVYHYGFGWRAPYDYASLPVVLGTLGGLSMVVGCAGLWWLKARRDPATSVEADKSLDISFIVLLLLVGGSGLALLALRESAWMGTLLVLHLGTVLALFASLPYGKFVHGIYRTAALLKYALERKRPGLNLGGD